MSPSDLHICAQSHTFSQCREQYVIFDASTHESFTEFPRLARSIAPSIQPHCDSPGVAVFVGQELLLFRVVLRGFGVRDQGTRCRKICDQDVYVPTGECAQDSIDFVKPRSNAQLDGN